MALHGTSRKYAVVHINNQGLEPVVLGLMQRERSYDPPSRQQLATGQTSTRRWSQRERGTFSERRLTVHYSAAT